MSFSTNRFFKNAEDPILAFLVLLLVIGVTTGLAFFMAPWSDQFHQVLEGSEKTLDFWWLLSLGFVQRMVNCWFGARSFGLLGSPKMKGIVT